MPKKIDGFIVEGARIIFRNFSGEKTQYNAKGDRNFCVVLDDDTAHAMIEDGWNVKWLPPREEEDTPTPYIKVRLKYDGGRPPRVTLVTSGGRQLLTEDTVEVIDMVDIKSVDVMCNPFWFDVNGKTGYSAYLKTMFVEIDEDPLEQKWGSYGKPQKQDEPDPEED